MEGNGPLNGVPRELSQIILADDPVAADATCARLMGFDPEKIAHIRAGAQFLGNSSVAEIDQIGEALQGPKAAFAVVKDFAYLHVPQTS